MFFLDILSPVGRRIQSATPPSPAQANSPLRSVAGDLRLFRIPHCSPSRPRRPLPSASTRIPALPWMALTLTRGDTGSAVVAIGGHAKVG